MPALPTPEARTALIARVKAILLAPRDEWPKIAAEPATVGSLYSSYVIYLAAIPPLCMLIGSLVFGFGIGGITYRPSLLSALGTAIVEYGFQLGGVYVLARIIEALAPRFGGNADRVSAFKLAAYSATASWVAGVFSLLPMLSVLALLGLYSLYLLYTGVPIMMRVPADRALGFIGMVIAIGFVVGLVVAAISAAILPGRGPETAGKVGGTISLPGGINFDLERAQKAAKRLEEMSKQTGQPSAESGEPSSDSGAEPSSGDKGISPPPGIAPNDLKSVLPASLPGGFARTEISTASGGAAGFNFGNAKAVYAKSDSSITLSLTDMGAMGALAALGSAFGANTSEETATSYSKMGQVDGRMTIEEFNRETKSGKYSIIVGDRIMVEAEGTGTTMDELKSAVGALDLGSIEAMAK